MFIGFCRNRKILEFITAIFQAKILTLSQVDLTNICDDHILNLQDSQLYHGNNEPRHVASFWEPRIEEDLRDL